MAQKESFTEKTATPNAAAQVLSEYGAVGKKTIEELGQLQSELFEIIKQSNQHWLDRTQTEAALASDLATKLTAARTIPDSTAACQEWAGRRIALATKDAEYVAAESRRLFETAARLFSNGLLSNGRIGST